MKKREGSILDVLTVLVSILAMSVVMVAYLSNVQIVSVKEDISQVGRKYILRMETVGYLTATDRAYMNQELAALGLTNISLSGTTMSDVGYGNPITLKISGRIQGREMIGNDLFSITFGPREYEIVEKRVSTAKN